MRPTPTDKPIGIAELLALRHIAPSSAIDSATVIAHANEQLLCLGAGMRALGVLLRDYSGDDLMLAHGAGFLIASLGDISTELSMLIEESR